MNSTEVFDDSLQDRIAKLIRLLASDMDGEALAAVRVLGRTLESRGLSFHSLADRLSAPARSPPPRWDDGDKKFDWRAAFDRIDARRRRGEMSERESDTFLSIFSRVKVRLQPLTPEQMQWLHDHDHAPRGRR